MINISYKKVYNAYIIESYNYSSIKNSIKDFAIANGFDKALVDSDNHPDILYIESPDDNISIDSIRQDIVETAIYSPKIADLKIYVVYDAIHLAENAQNAMLKTLEEPPVFDVFFLVTSNSNKLLETIRSRCITIKDDESINYKYLLDLDYIRDAILMLANAKSASASDKMRFAEIFAEKDNKLKDLIMLYRYLIRDALVYKMTLSKKQIYLKELEDDIITLSYTYDNKEFATLIESLNKLSDVNRNNVNKKIAVFNFFGV
ncbi:MAG: hypothetical protein J6P02_05410 [Lachnospiraceae bacterium]|nr:hypothetical protein [Lachnospiraceae bacterium]